MLAVMLNVFLRLRLERLPADVGAEIKGLALVSEFRNCGYAANFHAANWILEAAFVTLLFHC